MKRFNDMFSLLPTCRVGYVYASKRKLGTGSGTRGLAKFVDNMMQSVGYS